MVFEERQEMRRVGRVVDAIVSLPSAATAAIAAGKLWGDANQSVGLRQGFIFIAVRMFLGYLILAFKR